MSFGFGFGFPSWRTLAGGFSPAALFVGGVQGAWYDPSDLTTLFDSSTGTTPVSMPGQGAAVPVGLMLDKSQGLVLGTQYAPSSFVDPSLTWDVFTATTNGFFATKSTAGGSDNAYSAATVVTVLGAWYKIEIDVSSITLPNFFVFLSSGYNARSTQATFTASGAKTYVAYVQANLASGTFSIRVGTTALGSITVDGVRAAELPGNHAIAFNNTTARPELRARVNLLTYSEEFQNAAWSKVNFLAFGSGSIANATTAPNGTVTADLLVPNTSAAAEHYVDIGPSTVVVSGTTYTISWFAKADGYKWLRLAFNSSIAPANERAAWFDIEAGTIGTVQPNVTASIQAQGDGWYRCSISRSATASTTTTFGFAMITNADQGLGFTANGTSGMYWWGADLRPANIGANVPAYQRIADANTYDTNGFPLYLRFDGIDDSMYTPANLNLSGTDKATVFAGVRKLSDAASAVLTEFSADRNANNGAFTFAAPAGGALRQGYAFFSKGTITAFAEVDTGYQPPITNIITGIGNISGDSVILRINGTQAASSAVDQGTGNFGTYPLYIGARNNASAWFNGHLHSLIIAGSAVSAGNISATEQWVAGKTGIQI